MRPELAEALAARGRVWGQDNDLQREAVRRDEVTVKLYDRPCVAAHSISLTNTGNANAFQRVWFSGTVTRIPPAP